MSVSDWAGLRGRGVLACLLPLLIVACGQRPYGINLMPVPVIYEDGRIDPFAGESRIDESIDPGIFYATLRPPVSDGGPPFYLDERGEFDDSLTQTNRTIFTKIGYAWLL